MCKCRNTKIGVRICILLLLAAMLLTLFPKTVKAEESTDNLVLNKTAQLEDDGTYTINLEAYAKGNVTTTTVKQAVPTDIILVLDQSGSMAQQEITGIPGNTYSEANPTNAEVVNGDYYCKVGDSYYKVTATKEIISSSIEWVGDDGKTYTSDQLSYSWNRKSDGQTYNTARPFVTSSLSTWTRDYSLLTFKYVNDATGKKSDALSGTSAARARDNFSNTYAKDGYTVEFHNDGAPAAGNTSEDNPYYVAAVYIAVSQKEVNTYRYTYTYTDDNGKVITLGTSATGTETEVDTAACSQNPLYSRDTTNGKRLDALKYAANNFINNIHTNAVVNGVDHRVAVVGFASADYGDSNNEYYYSNTELFVGGTQYNYAESGKESTYNTRGNLAENHYNEAFQSAATDVGYSNLTASVNALAGKGATRPSLGFEMANGIFNVNTAEYTLSDGTTGTRNRIVVFLTDGEPGDSGYDATEASNTLSKIQTTKDSYNATVYTVAVLDGEPSGDNATDIKNFLNNSSSSGSYTLATSTADLEGFFKTIDKDINNTETTVSLSENSYLVDRLSDYFVVPEGFNIEDNVTVQIAQHVGDEAFSNPKPAPTEVTASLSTNSNGEVRGVSVKGFNFVSSDNLVTTDVSTGGSTIANGNKLIITIKGLLAKDAAATGTYIDTNTNQSGIWDVDSEGIYGMVKAFNMPRTMLDKKMFVLDYAKSAALDVYDATKVDSDEDQLFSQVSDADVSLDEQYGSVTTDSGLQYMPKTTKWDGYDSFYALGKDATVGDVKTQNIWSKVSVIPANNVYYEDDFVTDTSNGTVGIVYDGTWTTDGTSSGNKETVNTDVHGGWQNTDLADDATYSDESAHMSSTQMSTATFSFTGTGVDVYSRTNMQTGIVRAQLYVGDNTTASAAMAQSLVVDDLAESGDYYQIPTVSFANLDYGTYTVKLTVGSKAGRSTYYLDGIRVYNPLSEETEMDDTVSEAYGDEVGAVFTEVRDILIDEADEKTEFDQGVVFLDKDNGTNSYVVADYVDYGPKNEVYLKKGQKIAFVVNNDMTLSVGLKAPEGSTNAQITNGNETSTLNINAASDLYYKITPNDKGYVVIENTGDKMLSVTKLKTSSEAPVTTAFSMPVMLCYVDEFDSLPVVEYTLEATNGDQTEEIDTSETEGDIVIENPGEEETTDQPVTTITWLEKLINGFKKLFGRR